MSKLFSLLGQVMASGVLASFALPSYAVEISGQGVLEHRQFFSQGLQGQEKGQTSVVIEPELYWSLTDSSDFTLVPFYRLDSMDEQRTHFDLREALYLKYWDQVELRAGVGKVFWGVTESQHLVDVVNQTDAIESVDGEDKLGQPMLHLTSLTDYGTLDTLLLPIFRERTFAGVDGRIRPTLPVSDSAEYESSRQDRHLDFALRYSIMLDDWDLGLSYFQGTNRDPYYRVVGSELRPYYAQAKQLGLDVQGIVGDWLWKFESIYRDSQDHHTGLVSGFEYTQVGFWGTVYDVGWIGEYLYDSRGNNAQTLGQNDLFLGLRVAMNDADSSELLFGITQDLDNHDVYNAKLEASSRLTNRLSWNLNAWLFENDSPSDLLYFARKDDFVELSLEYYF
ncbi:hypothetical protein FCU94_05930 [Vibrio sp. JPW-9-11-11]|uniref:hypothetical protein n=1 Tax=Vibrio sp. JPW-9-11-11 TaxID=1416532 RepID=UPI0015935A8F|nr:hypothetical protein [Vibrio sp. JPW-9-11-11]NVD06447.1 hypothetical protein [Vibrio sp. JPW-9-11-11]